MLDRILHFSVNQRLIVIAATAILIGIGASAWQTLNLDAVPDITTNQVQINTETGGMGPEEVERLVTFPIEAAMGGLPGVQGTRSLSQYGLSQITVTFDDGVDIFFARQLVNERLGDAELPDSMRPKMGPVSTGLGDIYMFTIESDERTPMELRTLMDWQIAPQLRTVPGVAEINVADGSVKQFQVVVDPQRLQAHNIGIGELVEALQSNNQNAGGGVLDMGGERILIRSVGAAAGKEDIETIPLATEGGTPILVRDVAEVELGTPILTGISTKDGKEAILAVGMMLKGANGRTVAQALDAKIGEVRTQLPKDVRLTTVYNRADLVDKTVGTVSRSLLEGGVLVVAVLLILLGNLRGALIVAAAIPLSMLVAIIGMNAFGISGNLMSLGAIDFGLIVDGAVVMIENAVRRVSQRRESTGRRLTRREVQETVETASKEVGKPTAFAVAIITVVYLPILALEGTEGKMFKPMGFTVVFALLGALFLTLTLIPALAGLCLSGDRHERRNPVMDLLSRLYRPVVAWACNPWGVVGARYPRNRPSVEAALGRLSKAGPSAILGGAIVLLITAGFLFSRLGSEFIPTLDEGDLVVQPIRIRTVDAEQTVKLVTAAERKALEVPEVLTIFSRSGTPEVASDPMPLSLTDSFVMLKERSKWRPGMTKERIRVELEEKLEQVPGQGYNFSQPIQMRFSELVSGVRADIGIKVFGENLAVLRAKAEEIAAAMRRLPGAADVEVEQVDAVPVLQVDLDREAMARHGVRVADVQQFVSTALGGLPVGQIIEGDKRFDLVVRVPSSARAGETAIGSLPIKTPSEEMIPLSELATIGFKQVPAQISRESGKRRVVVQLNVRGVDLGTFVRSAQAALSSQVSLPEGVYTTWGGQFENLQRATSRLTLVVPIALGLIFALLFMTFGSLKQATLIFTGVPLAVTGGIVALWLRGMPFSISAGVGFIALSGVAVLNGVVLVSAINRLREEGLGLTAAVRLGAEQRLRPVLMTALVAALGFVPMALSTGIGSEVQRPLATVVIGGIVSATLLTLVVLPVLYSFMHRSEGDTIGMGNKPEGDRR